MTKRGESTPTIANAQAIVVDPVGGVVEYQWADGDTDEPGEYVAEFATAFMTVPSRDMILVTIAKGLR